MHSKWQGNLNAGPWYWEGHGNPGVGLRAGIVTSTNQDGRQQIFAVGDNGSMYTKWQTTLNGGWSGWEGHGNPGAALQAVLGSHNPV